MLDSEYDELRDLLPNDTLKGEIIQRCLDAAQERERAAHAQRFKNANLLILALQQQQPGMVLHGAVQILIMTLIGR